MPLPGPPPQSDHSRSVFRNNLSGETAYQRHQRLAQSAQLYYGQTYSASGPTKTDFEVLKDSHRFLRDDDVGDPSSLSYEDAIAVKYYRSLFKEYAVCDLKHYKSGNIALRWRTEDEVVSGAGQFTCGNTRCAYHGSDALEGHRTPALLTLELPFGYTEDGEAKSALVKVVLCTRCKKKLTWKRDQEKAAANAGGEQDGRSSQDHANGAEDQASGSRRRTEGSDEDEEDEPRNRKRSRREAELSSRKEKSSTARRKSRSR